mmetsp:Transcript_8962/g.14594  ORF Transcript_8962/g.14594 Transcript_8962/m.14594 type:complete len:279 (+) Transcript_8962:151-987(+)
MEVTLAPIGQNLHYPFIDLRMGDAKQGHEEFNIAQELNHVNFEPLIEGPLLATYYPPYYQYSNEKNPKVAAELGPDEDASLHYGVHINKSSQDDSVSRKRKLPGKLGNLVPDNNEKKVKKGVWSPDEDKILREAMERDVDQKIGWNIAAENLNRSSKQCRERWVNHLDPAIRKSKWTTEEDEELMQYHDMFPGKWAAIAKQLKRRSQNQVKVRVRTILREGRRERPSRGLQDDDPLLLHHANGRLNCVGSTVLPINPLEATRFPNIQHDSPTHNCGSL